ncbi:unnamed protein product, partial [Allacma fusca]
IILNGRTNENEKGEFTFVARKSSTIYLGNHASFLTI